MDTDECIWAIVYLLGRPSANKTASKVTYSRRRYPENIYRPPRQENKCSFWEPASYDNLSAHFNGVQSVTVLTLDVDPSFIYVLAFLRTRPFACTNLYRWIYSLSHSFSLIGLKRFQLESAQKIYRFLWESWSR